MAEIVVDVGCGENKVNGSVGVDARPCKGVDIVCRIDERLPFNDGTVDRIWCRHVLEHMADLECILREFRRILKDTGTIHIVVPHFTNSLAFSDYTHKRFFGLYTFDYFSSAKSSHWWVPNYVQGGGWFCIKQKRLVFRNLGRLGSLVDKIVNHSDRTAYLYEAKMAWLIPCFEIYFLLTKTTAAPCNQ